MFRGVAKRCRKPDIHILPLGKHDATIELTSDAVNDYERKAWSLIAEQGYKLDKNSAELRFNHASFDGMFETVNLMPFKRQLIMK